MSLTALTNLNQMLIRSALRFTTEPTEEDVEDAADSAGNSIIDATGTGGGVFLIPDTSGPPEFRGFAATDKFGFERVVEWMQQNAAVSGLSTTLVDAFVEGWALKWRGEHKWGPTDSIMSVPTVEELIDRDDFAQGAFWLPLTAGDQLPPLFRTAQQVTDEEGNVTEVALIAVPDPLTGVEFIEETVSTDVGADEFGGNVVTNREIVDRIIADQMPESFASTVRAETGETNLPRFLERRGILPGAEDPTVVPTISIDELTAMLEGPAPSTGGGTSTRRDISFDRDHLIDQVDQLWKSWYRQGAPQNRVEGIVDSYIRQARAFWNGDGGQLNFDTFVRSKLRTQPLYRSMFRHKPEATSEEQFIADFEAPISQLGLRGDLELEQTRAAVMSGGSPAGQFQRVSQTREAQLGGGFSQQLAQTLAGLGAGSRA